MDTTSFSFLYFKLELISTPLGVKGYATGKKKCQGKFLLFYNLLLHMQIWHSLLSHK